MTPSIKLSLYWYINLFFVVVWQPKKAYIYISIYKIALIRVIFMVEGRCMKCKEQREMKDPKEVIMKNGLKAVTGTCVKCGTKMFKILGKA